MLHSNKIHVNAEFQFHMNLNYALWHTSPGTPMIFMWGRWHTSLSSCPCASDYEKHYGLYEYYFEKTTLYPCIFLSLNTIHNTFQWMFVIVRFAFGSRYCTHNKTGVSWVLITNGKTEVYAGITSFYTRLTLPLTHVGQLQLNTPSHVYTNEQIQWQYGSTKIHWWWMS
jgi:hypothetical protein